MGTQFDIIVIGAGPGGYEAAIEAARLGLRTAVIEKNAVGGTCLNRGCIPTKTLMHCAGLCSEIRGASRFGVSAGEPSVDMEAVQQHKEATVETLRKGILSLFKAGKISLYEGTGKVVTPESVEVTPEEGEPFVLDTRRILLATGSTPALPPIPGITLPGVMTSDELLSWRGEPFSSLLVIGGGVIGVEFAGIYQSLGTKVTILEALPSLLANMDRELGQSVKLSLKKRGADIHTGARVEGLEQTEHGICCTYTEKEQLQTCEAQAVLIAVGRRPYTQGLFAEGCVPQMERGFVVVDGNYQTSIPGIYAVGDVNGRLQLAHAASVQGRQAVRRIRAELSRPVPDPAAEDPEPLLIPSCVYTDPEIASVGLTLDQAKAQGLAAKSHKIVSSANGKSVLSLQDRGFVKVVYLEDTHVIIGAQLLCARATDMVSEFAVAIRQGMTMEEMEAVVRPHPSFSEMISDAVRLFEEYKDDKNN